MELKPIELNPDTTLEMYQSENCRILFKSYGDYYNVVGYSFPWIGYLVIRDQQVVGSCGFKGAPRDGKVEIAYWTFSEFEGQGIASFSCGELLKVAYNSDHEIVVTATTEPAENASTKILRNNGFEYNGVVQDHEIGDAWLWTHKKS